MTKLIVPSKPDPVIQRSELEQRIGGDIVTTRYSVSFQVNRGEGKEHKLDVDGADVVELEMEDGQKLWIRVDELESEFGIDIKRSANADVDEADTVRIPTDLPLDGRTRGIGTWVIKGLKVLGVDIAGGVADFVSGKVEGKQLPGPGLYQCTDVSAENLQQVSNVDRSKPILVFLHGTASSTDGSFSALWRGGDSHIADLLSYYDGQVLAFQHKTLTLSPMENALELLKALVSLESTVQGKHPLRLHLVSHSRGGLIGEILCRGTKDSGSSFDEVDMNLFTGDQYVRDQNAMQQLGALLDETDLQVERFIRVACPARGTTLADGRLDRYFSGFVNILEKVPGVANPVVDGVTSLLLAVVHKRTEPEELPGLEAMMPTSPTIRMLNRPDISVKADLHVIGGDVKASGFINRLKVIITDLFYREDHDLVVNTPSMLGGASRVDGVRYWVDTGSKVNHFQYFGNGSTASRLTTGLMQSEAAFHTLDVKPYEVRADDYRKRTLDPQPIVFVLPGTMGSHLAVNGDCIWLDFLQVARGRVSRLSIDKRAPQVQPLKPLDSVYGELMKYLAATHDVRPFAYDWRISITDTAELLRLEVEKALEEAELTDQPLRFVAHSMGGLVVRTMLATAKGKALWKRISAHSGSRFIMLGTPNGGSYSMAVTLMGRDALVHKLALLDFKNSYADLLKTIARFDGALQLLPHTGTLDLYNSSNWEKLYTHDVPEKRSAFSTKVATSKSSGVSWVIPDKDQLKDAKRVRDLIASSPIDPEHMIYVAGSGSATAVDVVINENARPGRQVRVFATNRGDGTVTWESGIPASMPARNVYFMDAVHGDMTNTIEAFPALLQLLETGSTRLLSNTPAVSRGGEDERFVMPPAEADMYPDRDDLIAAVTGGSRKRSRLPARKCKVRIVHGDLARSRFPVSVGHYDGDTIVSAEGYLDRQLDGRLRERHRLGMYPGRKGTSTILLNWPEAHERRRAVSPVHPGAIVVGLGTVGDLTPGALTSTLVDGLMRYALETRDKQVELSRQQSSDLPPTVYAPLTTLLISANNDLNISDSLRSILRAVALVNQRLQPPSDDQDDRSNINSKVPYVRIPELDIIEYMEDRAIQATRALVGLADTREFTETFEIHRQVVTGKDGRRRASFDEVAGWWQRMRISALANDDLKFETLTERARVESQLQSTQRILVDRFLSRAAASPTYDPSLGKTLFELVMPNQLKQYAPDRRDLILMLDDKAAAYPWELLQDGADSAGRPLAVESGVVRQLVSGEFRPQPLMSQSPTALVIGDPVADKLNGAAFPPLPGAADEARQVAAQLNAAAYDTLSLVGEDASPLDVVTALYAQPYRIVHIAAHGVFEQLVDEDGRPIRKDDTGAERAHSSSKRVSGVVLGDGIYLTPSEFEQMRNVPELVFINCCHLGKHADGSQADSVEYHRLASNVATQLIRMGVRAVVAAGWAVDDDAAKLFARVFYEQLLAGNTFGKTVRTARRASYDFEQRRNGNTWGAYQCYGDPDFSLSARHGVGAASESSLPLSPSEFEQILADMARDAAYAPEVRQVDLLKELEQLIKVTPEDWYASGSVCSAVATAFAQSGDLRQATDYYQKANASATADASISSLEQLANMKSRLAAQLTSNEESTESLEKQAQTELADAENIIDSLIEINQSQERYVIKGGVHKRRAMLGTRSIQLGELKKMNEAYQSAYEAGLKDKQGSVFYPLQNIVAAQIALGWCTGEKNPPGTKKITGNLERLQSCLEATDMRDADFWTACQEPDLLLLRALANNRILSRAELPDIRTAYAKAAKRGSSARERSSIDGHLQFFRAIAKIQLRAGKEKTALIESLDKLLADLADASLVDQ